MKLMPSSSRFLVAVFLVALLALGGSFNSSLAQDQQCRLEKVGTFAEVGNAGPQRIELGGGGTQHADLYPARGIKSVSFLVPPTEPLIYMGFGSIWEGDNSPPCASFDWVKDATSYAECRLNNGHSGLVVDLDLRSGKAEIVANVGGLSDEEVSALLAQHEAAVEGGKIDLSNAEVATDGRPRTATGTATGGEADCEAVRQDHDPSGEDWVLDPGDGFIVANVWSNAHDPNLSTHKMWIAEKVALPSGGGSAWIFGKGCEDAARAAFLENSNPEISIEGYDDYVRTGKIPEESSA